MSTEDYLAIEGNELLDDVEEVLLRQVHPVHLHGDVPTSQAFEPTAEHLFLLSTKREDFGAQEACEAHLSRGLETAGTWGFKVTVASDAGLPCVDDAIHVQEVGHASVSFMDLESRGQRTQKARKLRDGAVRLHPSEPDQPAAV